MEHSKLPPDSPPPSRKHTSVHLYNTIETLKRDGQFRLNDRARRTQSDIHDYDDPQVPSVNLLHSNTRVQPSGKVDKDEPDRTASSVPSEYEVPSSCSRATDCTLRNSLSSESSYELMESYIDDELWKRYSQNWGIEIPQREVSNWSEQSEPLNSY